MGDKYGGKGGGPVQGHAAFGFDRPYDACRNQAEDELQSTMAGPKDDDPAPAGVKDPDSDKLVPSRGSTHRDEASSLTSAGARSGRYEDPEGQQGGPCGGKAPKPPLRSHPTAGEPLQDGKQRARTSVQQPGTGAQLPEQ